MWYLVWVGVSGAQQSLVLIEQHPELTVKLRLVQQLTQHGTAGGDLSTLRLRTEQEEIINTYKNKNLSCKLSLVFAVPDESCR